VYKRQIDEIMAIGAPVLFVETDISDKESREHLVYECIKEFGKIDVLVNNAGVAPRVRADLLEISEESMDFVLDINLKGTFFLTQLVANKMIGWVEKGEQTNPRIINVSSISAYTSSVNRPEYCISKAGISMMTKLFADRLAEYGILVYEVRPGIVMTDMTSKVKEKYDKLIGDGLTPIKRWGLPEDVANAVSSLCSDGFLFSTGQVVNVDGGFNIRRL
jgi:NAD(P)-dependent dehydrogenase (short-subunit alcohol dehydrogenase family)